MRYYCTYFDGHYLNRGLALLESLRQHETSRFTLFVVCMDEITRVVLTQLAIPEISLVPLHEIERRDEVLLSTKQSRSLVEYYWTMTPTILLRILERHREIDLLTYLDADLFFFSSPQPLFEELGQNSILIHEHRYSPTQAHLSTHNGRFNVGLLSFRRDSRGFQALRWWRERCLEWCFARYEQGKMGDQLYLEDWPTRFTGVTVLQHRGGGVGPWNHDQYAIRVSHEGHTLVENDVLIFYHFHSLKLASPDLAVPVAHPHYRLTIPGLTHCFIPYLEALARAHDCLTQVMPDRRWGLEQSLELSSQISLLARRALAGKLASCTGAYQLIPLGNGWDAYCSEQVIDRANSPLVSRIAETQAPTFECSQGLPPSSISPLPKDVFMTAGASQHELLISLADSPTTREIRTLCVGGAHRYQERDLFDRLFPNLQHIYLFEPIAELARQLKQIERTDSRVRVFPFALSDRNGEQEFFITNNDGESSSLLRLGKHREIFPHVKEVQATRVQCRTLDHVIQEAGLPKPDMLLLDVQGAEHRILASLSSELKRHIQVLYVEASLDEVYQGAGCLNDLVAVLADDHQLVSFAPLSPQSPTHGNALFVNRRLDESRVIPGEDKADPNAPLISAIVSSYGAEAFMEECLEDLEQQTMAQKMEIIVVDAASPENERAIVSRFQERCRNITYLRTPTRIGVYAAWNLALRIARGRYITPFSTNDRLRPDAYELLARALDEHPDVTLVYGDTYLTELPHQTFSQHHRVGMWKWPDYDYDTLLRKCGVGPHPMWRRTIHEAVGYFDETYIALGDQDFWIRLGARHKLLHIPVVTGLYWHSPEGLSNRAEIAGPEERRLRSTYLKQTCTPSPTPVLPVPPSATQFDCSVIIPVWNRCELTQDCITALAKTTEGLSWELIVVDNHSTDRTPEFLSSLGGDVQIIRNQDNLGFAKACNQGARAAKGKYLVFLNNATIPLDNWLRELAREVEEHPEVGVVGSKLLYMNGTVQHAGVVFSKSPLSPYHIHRLASADLPAVNQRREFQAVTAACMLVRKTLFDEIGGFDEGFCNGFEDVDLCLKVRERGARIVYQPRSVLYHLESQTPGRKLHDERNGIRFQERWASHWWLSDEDLHYHRDGYKLIESSTNGKPVSSIQLLGDIKDRAAWAHIAATQAAAQKKDWAAVRRELRLVHDWPGDPYVLSWAAIVCEKLEEALLQQAFLSRYLELTDSPTVRVSLVRTLLGQKDLVAADHHLQKLLAVSPAHAEGLLLCGILCMQREQYREAEASFSSALQRGADRKKCLMGMGMAALGRAYAQGAWERFLQVLAENSDDAEAIHWLLRAGTVQNRWAELSHQLRNYLSRNPGDLAARFALASVLLRAEQIDAARREHDALRALDPAYDGLAALGQAIAGKETVLAMEASHR